MKYPVCFTLCVVIAACNWLDKSGSSSGRWHVQPGAIIFYGDSSDVEIPDTVRVGEPFRVSATTFGGGCTRAAGLRTDLQDLNAAVTPIDSVYAPGPNEACTTELRVLNHHAEIEFSTAGKARVVVRGVRRGPDSPADDEVTLERSVVVIR